MLPAKYHPVGGIGWKKNNLNTPWYLKIIIFFQTPLPTRPVLYYTRNANRLLTILFTEAQSNVPVMLSINVTPSEPLQTFLKCSTLICVDYRQKKQMEMH